MVYLPKTLFISLKVVGVAYWPVLLLLLLTFLIGSWRSQNKPTFFEYVLAQRTLGTSVMTMTLLATCIGGSTFVYYPNAFCKEGLVGFVHVFILIIGILVFGYSLGPKLRRFDTSYTLGEIVGRIYGSHIAQWVTGMIGVWVSILHFLIQMLLMGKTVAAFYPGVDPFYATTFSLLIVSLYTAWGGIRTIAYTDVLQFFAIMLCTALIAEGLLNKVGGLAGLSMQVPPSQWHVFTNKPMFFHNLVVAFSVALLPIPIFMLMPCVVQRALMSLHERQLREMFFNMALFFTALLFLLGLIGLTGIPLQASAANSLLIELTLAHLSPLVQKITFAGLVAIILSTADSILGAAGIVLLHDVFNAFSYKKMNFQRETMQLRRVRWCTLACALIAFYCMLLWPNLSLSTISYYSHGMMGLITVPLFIPLYSSLHISMRAFFASIASNMLFMWLYVIEALPLLDWAYQSSAKYAWMLIMAQLVSVIAFMVAHLIENKGRLFFMRSYGFVLHTYSWSYVKKYMAVWWQRVAEKFKNPLAYFDEKLSDALVDPFRSVFFIGIITMFPYGGQTSPTPIEVYDLLKVGFCIAVILLAGMMTYTLWPASMQKYRGFYWFVTIGYSCGFFSTLLLLYDVGDSYSLVRWVVAFFLLFVFVGRDGALLVLGITFPLVTLIHYLHMGIWLYPSELVFIKRYPFVYLMLLIFAILFFFDSHFYFRWTSKVAIQGVVKKDLAREEQRKHRYMHDLEGESHAYLHHFVKTINGLAKSKGIALEERDFLMNFIASDTFQALSQRDAEIQEHKKLFKQAVSDKKAQLVKQVGGAMKLPARSMQSLLQEVYGELGKIQAYGLYCLDRTKLRLEEGEDFYLKMLPKSLSFALSHIVGNAFLHGGAEEVLITLSGERRTLSIFNDGALIPEKERRDIFSQQVAFGSTKGHGMGLYLVRFLMERYGGKIVYKERKQGDHLYGGMLLTFPLLTQAEQRLGAINEEKIAHQRALDKKKQAEAAAMRAQELAEARRRAERYKQEAMSDPRVVAERERQKEKSNT